jgi:hypothetical protein
VIHHNTTKSMVLVAAVLLCGTAAHADIIELKSLNPVDFGQFGISVDGIPDINGDGAGDVIVGAWDETVGGTQQAGRVYVYSGRTGLLIRSHFSPNAEFQGAYGWSVSGIGDINNDGRGDYMVGAYAENGLNLSDSGRVYVYSGATGALIRTHTMPGAEANGRFGFSLDAVPDLTNDGEPDYVVGATGGGTDGEVFVFSGASGALVRTTTAPASAAGGEFGFSVAGVPDATGDGRGDYAVGAPFADPGSNPFDSGMVYVFNGANGSLQVEFDSPNAESSGQFGFSLAGIEDVGGNNLGDVIVGAWLEDVDADVSAGRAYIMSGTLGTLNQDLVSPNSELNGNFGVSVAAIGDRDGDGTPDVLIGAAGDGGGNASPGRAYVLSGADGSTIETLQSAYASSGNREFGGSVAAVPDANEDNLPDYIIGANEDEGADGLPNEGRAYLIRNLRNDGCSDVFFGDVPQATEGANFFTTIGATGGGSGTGCTGETFTNDVWFTYVATCTGTVQFSTCSFTNFDTKIAVYDGCGFTPPFFFCDLSTLLDCDDDGCGTVGGGSKAFANLTAGDCVRIRVGGFNGDTGFGILFVDCVTPCPGDLDKNGTVDAADLAILLGAWGSSNAVADINDNGTVDANDLALLLGNWGSC